MSQYIETETTEASGETMTPTVSGNDTGDGGTVEGGSSDSGTAGETGGSGGTGSDGENIGTEPDTPVTPAPSPSVPTEEETFTDSVLSGLDSISGKLDEVPSYDTLADSLRSLVDIMTVQAEEERRLAEEQEDIPLSVPLADYESYAYPVSVTYRLYPSGLSSETDTVETYADAEGFRNGYSSMRGAMEDGTLAWFSILSVDDAQGVRVYDASSLTYAEGEDSPDTEEPDTFKEDVLSALDTLHGDLESVSMNGIGYYTGSLDLAQATLDLQEQCLALQQENRELSYHMLACDIATGFVLLLALGYTIARGFFQRMKAG